MPGMVQSHVLSFLQNMIADIEAEINTYGFTLRKPKTGNDL